MPPRGRAGDAGSTAGGERASRGHGGDGPERRNLEGAIDHITYQNEENGYTVARLATDRGGRVTVVGDLAGAQVGASYRLTGYWTSHAQYGRQFQIESFEERLPATVEGMRRYLGSGLIHGVGPVTAERIVDHFGLDTLDVIEHDPERLHEVPGVGRKRAAQITDAWEEQRKIKEIMLFLQSHGVAPGLSIRIFKAYEDEAIRILREDPYQLARDASSGGVYGVGFKTADRVARDLGLPTDSPRRVEAGIIYTLERMAGEGHTNVPRERLIEQAAEHLAVDGEPTIQRERIDAAVGRLAGWEPDPAVVLEDVEEIAADGMSPAATDAYEAVYLPPFYYAEVGIANRIGRLLSAPDDALAAFGETDWEGSFQWLDAVNPHRLADAQRRAVRTALTEKVAILTGGPGTGKTTTVRSILHLARMRLREPRILLAAPTGRAAKRLAETTGVDARTVHRLLEFKPAEGRLFQRHEDRPLEADLIVVDEMSMVDTLLMNHLVKAVDAATHLLLVGDVDQLPSVGPGNVLRDLIRSGTVPTVELDEVFRQDERSWITVNAHRINRGRMPEFSGDSRDFFLFGEREPEDAAARVIDVVANRIPRKFGLHPVEDIQVLSPMHRGAAGVAALNERLQAALNPPRPDRDELPWGDRTLRVGDKVMQVRNNYEKDIFNGDIGRILGIDRRGKVLTVGVEDREVSYAFDELDELVLAFACSIHKSQGAEYPCVVIALLPQHWMLLQRNLLYTAVTRARQLCVLVGSRKAIRIAVRNDRVAERHTGLARRLMDVAPARR